NKVPLILLSILQFPAQLMVLIVIASIKKINNVELIYSQIKEFDKITTAVVKSYKLTEIDKE
ncbi:hypothetical protein ACFL0J_06860, partial [Candidatus Neomarinimicrobiota bacterium]